MGQTQWIEGIPKMVLCDGFHMQIVFQKQQHASQAPQSEVEAEAKG